jgi:hypothetical protein
LKSLGRPLGTEVTGRGGIKLGFENTTGVEAALAVSVGSDSAGDISGGSGANANDAGELLWNSAIAKATTSVDAGMGVAPVNCPPTVFAGTSEASDLGADAGVDIDVDVDSDTSIEAGAGTGDGNEKEREVAIVGAACSGATCADEAKTVVIVTGEMKGCEVEDCTGAVVGVVAALASAE